MVDVELLQKLRAAGVKSATFGGVGYDKIIGVEFFPQTVLDPVTDEFGKLAPLDTLIPPVNPGDGSEDTPPNIPAAFARILKGSVS